jgi:hypothetical protein
MIQMLHGFLIVTIAFAYMLIFGGFALRYWLRRGG